MCDLLCFRGKKRGREEEEEGGEEEATPEEDTVQETVAPSRQDNLGASVFATLADETLSHIFSFCHSLATLDLTCKAFGLMTPPHWEARARRRFGHFGGRDATGKSAYSKASALLRDPISIPLPRNDRTRGKGHAVMATNGRTLVTAYEGGDCIVKRDLERFKPIFMRGDTWAKQVVCVGAATYEVVVTERNNRWIHANRENKHVQIDMDAVHREHCADIPNRSRMISLIGNSKMLIGARNSHFFVFVPDSEELLKLIHVARIDENNDQAFHAGFCWASPEAGSNIFCCSTQRGRVCIWRADIVADTSCVLHAVSVVDLQTPVPYDRYFFQVIAVTENFIAVSPGFTNRVFVYRREGSLVSLLSEGVDQSDGGSFMYPITMFATGETLVTCSNIPDAPLCIWDMRQGALLNRCMHLQQEPRHVRLDEWQTASRNVANMLPLHDQGLVGFSAVNGPQYIWGFPGSQDQHTKLLSLAQAHANEVSDDD